MGSRSSTFARVGQAGAVNRLRCPAAFARRFDIPHGALEFDARAGAESLRLGTIHDPHDLVLDDLDELPAGLTHEGFERVLAASIAAPSDDFPIIARWDAAPFSPCLRANNGDSRPYTRFL